VLDAGGAVRRLAIAAAVIAAGCVVTPDEQPAPAARAVRWLPGLRATAVAEPAPGAAADDELDPGERCQRGAGAVVTVTADVAAAPGAETIRASITGGVEVLDADGAALARLTAFACGGSLDAIDALAAGDAGIGVPVIAVVATIGGRAEATTWIALFEVEGHRLHRVFTGAVAQRDGDAIERGAVAVDAGGLTYRAPRAGRAARWTFDPARRVFAPAR
jgi:hypothetical protein